MTKAIGYVRRSKESGERTVSLDDQTARVRAYAEAQGWQLAEVIVDDGVSGGKRERFERIKAAVAAHKAQAVVVYHLDRFARDVAGLLDTLRGFSRRGVELHAIGRGRIEAETASGFLTTSIEGVLAEHYRRLVGEKTRDALAHKAARGERVSRFAPYGFRFAADRVTVEADAAEQAVAERMVALRAEGLSLRAVAAALAADGLLARSGRPFSAETVREVVANRSVGDSAPLAVAA